MSKKILIFEDDKSLTELIRYYLEEEGYETKISLSMDNYFEKIIQYQPDLITIDFCFKNSDGLLILEALKKDMQFQSIPIVLITGAEFSPLMVEGIGAAGYITKPFDENKIKMVINSILLGAKS